MCFWTVSRNLDKNLRYLDDRGMAIELAHTLLVLRLTLLYVLCSVEEAEITTHTR